MKLKRMLFGACASIILLLSFGTMAKAAPTLTITSPSPSATWYKGTDYIIKWTYANYVGNVRIHVFKDGSHYATVAAGMPVENGASGVIFNAPTTWPTSNRYEIRISTLDDQAYDTSDYFAITTRSSSNWVHPVWPYSAGSYGGRSFFYDGNHLGEDEALDEGTPIRAIGPGIIKKYGPAAGYGELVVVIEHDLGRVYSFTNAYGKIVRTRYILSIYGHLRRSRIREGAGLSMKVGDRVTRNTIIGYVNDDLHNGDGAEHLHMGIRLSSAATAMSRDPRKWFRGYEGNTLFGNDFGAGSQVIYILQTTP